MHVRRPLLLSAMLPLRLWPGVARGPLRAWWRVNTIADTLSVIQAWQLVGNGTKSRAVAWQKQLPWKPQVHALCVCNPPFLPYTMLLPL